MNTKLINPYFELHREFRKAGAEVLVSSGQACVLLGIAAFSKDGDWIIRENSRSCNAVLKVLAGKGATYRLGAPLHPAWLSQGWTSHFEYRTADGLRARVDFCSRPPRISDHNALWTRAIRNADIDVVDIESLMLLKQTRRVRDYSIIGSIAQVSAFSQDLAEIALQHLWDFELLNRAVVRWPKQARACTREAVQLLLRNAQRSEVVASLAIEQDRKMQQDQARVAGMAARSRGLAKRFSVIRKKWQTGHVGLPVQHKELKQAARVLLE